MHADGDALPFADAAFDVVTCKLRAAPLRAAGGGAVAARDCGASPRVAPLVVRLAPLAAGLCATRASSRALSRATALTRHDAPLSVRRAYTPAEALRAGARRAGERRACGASRSSACCCAMRLTSSSSAAGPPARRARSRWRAAGFDGDAGRARALSAPQGLRRVSQRRAPSRRSTRSACCGRARRRARPLRGVAPACRPARRRSSCRFPAPALARRARASSTRCCSSAALDAGAQLVRGRVEGRACSRTGRVAGVVRATPSGRAADVARALRRRRRRRRFAGGAQARASRGRRAAPRRFAIGGHYRGFGDLDGTSRCTSAAAPYFALNPLDADRANVMVVVREGQLAAWSARRRRRRARRSGRARPRAPLVCRRASASARASAFGPLAIRRARRRARPGALLVGDAAGFLNPFTGQGVFLALRGAARGRRRRSPRRSPQPAREAARVRAYARAPAGDLASRAAAWRAWSTLLVDVPALGAPRSRAAAPLARARRRAARARSAARRAPRARALARAARAAGRVTQPKTRS